MLEQDFKGVLSMFIGIKISRTNFNTFMHNMYKFLCQKGLILSQISYWSVRPSQKLPDPILDILKVEDLGSRIRFKEKIRGIRIRFKWKIRRIRIRFKGTIWMRNFIKSYIKLKLPEKCLECCWQKEPAEQNEINPHDNNLVKKKIKCDLTRRWTENDWSPRPMLPVFLSSFHLYLYFLIYSQIFWLFIPPPPCGSKLDLQQRGENKLKKSAPIKNSYLKQKINLIQLRLELFRMVPLVYQNLATYPYSMYIIPYNVDEQVQIKY